MIINLTQHKATPEQIAAGVIDLPEDERQDLVSLLTFDSIPTRKEMEARSNDISELACFNGLGGNGDDPFPNAAMIGGAPYFMRHLEDALMDKAITPLYAFSARESVELVIDGKTVKQSVFRHVGFVGQS